MATNPAALEIVFAQAEDEVAQKGLNGASPQAVTLLAMLASSRERRAQHGGVGQVMTAHNAASQERAAVTLKAMELVQKTVETAMKSPEPPPQTNGRMDRLRYAGVGLGGAATGGGLLWLVLEKLLR